MKGGAGWHPFFFVYYKSTKSNKMAVLKGKTEKQLEKDLSELKAKLGEKPIFALTTYIDEDEEQERTIYLVKPNRLTRQAGEKEIQKSAWKGAEVFLRGMYKGGDDLDEIIKNDDAMMIASEQLVHVIKLRTGNVQRV